MVKVQCIRANCKLQIEPTSGCRKVKFIEEEYWCRKEEKTVGFVVGNISCGKVKEETKPSLPVRCQGGPIDNMQKPDHDGL